MDQDTAAEGKGAEQKKEEEVEQEEEEEEEEEDEEETRTQLPPGCTHLAPFQPQPCKRKRASLDEKSAVEIFLAKRTMMGARSGLSRRLANKYEVTAKAVRDVWVIRTWTNATKPYWSDAQANAGTLS